MVAGMQQEQADSMPQPMLCNSYLI
jgi:hypothetical protein